MAEALSNRPQFSDSYAQQLAWRYFGIDSVATELPGERDQNFRLLTNHSDYVLKIANYDADPEYLAFENRAIQLCNAVDGLTTPILLKSDNKSTLVTHSNSENGHSCCIRCFIFVPGRPLAQCQNLSDATLISLGRALASIDQQLKLLNHEKSARRYLKWDLANAPAIVEAGLGLHTDPAHRQLIELHFERFKKVSQKLESLEKSVIHNDANDYNWILNEDPSTGSSSIGIIDFGDMVYSATINDLAICGAYLTLDRQSPIEKVGKLIAGYNEVRGLSDSEINVLFPLMCMRLVQSVTIAAEQKQLRPDDDYLTITEAPAWRMLEQLAKLDPEDVKQRFYDARNSAHSENHLLAQSKNGSIQETRAQLIGPSLSLSYDSPLHITRGKGQYLYDSNGSTYLDCVNNVCHVGHCHPYVVSSISNQVATLNTNTRYLHENLTKLARRLTSTLPDSLDVCYFVNSGSEANDLALRLATTYTQREDFVVLDHAYHGHTSALIDISPYKFDAKGGAGCKSHVLVLPMPDGFRGMFRYEQADYGEEYIEHAIKTMSKRFETTPPAAFIAESLLSCGGQIILPYGYLGAVYRCIRDHGGLCIADEVQVGFGRVGKQFWGFQLQDVIPDIVTMGKPFGNGHPLAAVVTTREVANAFNNGMEYFNTYGGNPVSCAAGLAVLDVIEDENLQAHANDVGAALIGMLKNLQRSFGPQIGDVRGEGLFIGLEFVSDTENRVPDAKLAKAIVESMKTKNILLSTDGPDRNVIKIKPPMVFDHANAERLVSTLDRVLKQLI